jgi:uncharacterized protein YjbI with pentapeptide repeats
VQFSRIYAATHLVFKNCDFSGSVFKNCEGRLQLEDCNLSNVEIEGGGDFEFPFLIKLIGSGFNFEGCTFKNVNLRSIEEKQNFKGYSGAVFKNCVYLGFFDRAELFENAKLQGIFVNDYRFQGREGFYYLGADSNLQGADFTVLPKYVGNFSDAIDHERGLVRCNLRDTIFNEVYFSRDFSFSGSDLRDASLRRLSPAQRLDFSETDMRGTSFSIASKSNTTVYFLSAKFETSLFLECTEELPNQYDNFTHLNRIYFVFSTDALSESLLDIFGISAEISEICGPNSQYQKTKGQLRYEGIDLYSSNFEYVNLLFLGKYTKVCKLRLPILLPKNFDWSYAEIKDSYITVDYEEALVGVNFSHSKFIDSQISNRDDFHIQTVENCDFSSCEIGGSFGFYYIALKSCLFDRIKGDTLNFLLPNSQETIEGCSFVGCVLDKLDIGSSYRRPTVNICNFSEAYIENISIECDFYDTDFSRCHFVSGGVEESEIERCDFRGAVFGEKFSFDQTTFTDCVYDQHTKMNLEAWQWKGMTYIES